MGTVAYAMISGRKVKGSVCICKIPSYAPESSMVMRLSRDLEDQEQQAPFRLDSGDVGGASCFRVYRQMDHQEAIREEVIDWFSHYL